jgi:ferritin-like metal-binding protein YciE
MNNEQKENLIAWFNDAYAMEQSLVENLEQKAKDAEDAGESEAKIRIGQHAEQTKKHAKMVASCIEKLGGNLSRSKEVVGKMSGYFRGAAKSMYDDVMVKNVLEGYAAEHFEIASYTSLISAATLLGQNEIADICSEILEEEEEMAEWLEEQIPVVTTEYLGSKG